MPCEVVSNLYRSPTKPGISVRQRLRARLWSQKRVGRLSPREAVRWTPTQFAALDATVLCRLPTETMASLEPEQVQAFRWRQVEALSPEQLAAVCSRLNTAVMDRVLKERLVSWEERCQVLEKCSEGQRDWLVHTYQHPSNKTQIDILLALYRKQGVAWDEIRTHILQNPQDPNFSCRFSLLGDEHLAELVDALTVEQAGDLYLHHDDVKGRWRHLRTLVSKERVAVLEDPLASWRLPQYGPEELRSWSLAQVKKLRRHHLREMGFWSMKEAWKDDPKKFRALFKRLPPCQVGKLLPDRWRDWILWGDGFRKRRKLADNVQLIMEMATDSLLALRVDVLEEALVHHKPQKDVLVPLLERLSLKQLQGLIATRSKKKSLSVAVCKWIDESRCEALLGGLPLDLNWARDLVESGKRHQSKVERALLYHRLLPRLRPADRLNLLFDPQVRKEDFQELRKLLEVEHPEWTGSLQEEAVSIVQAASLSDLELLALCVGKLPDYGFLWTALTDVQMRALGLSPTLGPKQAQSLLEKASNHGRVDMETSLPWDAATVVVVRQWLTEADMDPVFECLFSLDRGVVWYFRDSLPARLREDPSRWQAVQSKIDSFGDHLEHERSHQQLNAALWDLWEAHAVVG